MGGMITHQLTTQFYSNSYGIYIEPYEVVNEIRMKNTDTKNVKVVNIDKIFATSIIEHRAVVPINNPYSVSYNKFVLDEVNKGIYMLKFQLCGMAINASLQMVTNEHGILRYTDGRSFEIAGEKYRVKNNSYCGYKPLLLSKSKERLLVHKNNDPLDIRQVTSGCVLDTIDLWDYDTDNKLLLPHLFRLEVEGKLRHNK